MGATYGGDPGQSDRDWVRFWIQDTMEKFVLSDPEIDALIVDEGSKEAAAVAGAHAIKSRYARLVDKSVGDLKISYSQRQAAYEDLIKRLERKLGTRRAKPFAGGLSIAGKNTVRADTDRVPPAFTRDRFTHPGAGIDVDKDEDDGIC